MLCNVTRYQVAWLMAALVIRLLVRAISITSVALNELCSTACFPHWRRVFLGEALDHPYKTAYPRIVKHVRSCSSCSSFSSCSAMQNMSRAGQGDALGSMLGGDISQDGGHGEDM